MAKIIINSESDRKWYKVHEKKTTFSIASQRITIIMKKKKKNHLYINKTFQHQRFSIIAIRYIFIMSVYRSPYTITQFLFSRSHFLTADFKKEEKKQRQTVNALEITQLTLRLFAWLHSIHLTASLCTMRLHKGKIKLCVDLLVTLNPLYNLERQVSNVNFVRVT